MKLSRTLDAPPAGDAPADRCVWVAAGVLSYKLCDHDFRCEQCPLDAELRHARRPEPERVAPGAERVTLVGDGQLLFFARNHVWVRVERSDAVVVGLDDFALRLLAPVRRFILPTKGAYVMRGDSMAIVVREAHSFIIDAPIGGRVNRVNVDLQRHPEAALADPAHKSWLLQFEPADLLHEMKSLYTGPGAAAWQQQEAAKLEVVLGTCPPDQVAQLGALMQDGRPRLDGLAQLLGEDRYATTVNAFLRPEL